MNKTKEFFYWSIPVTKKLNDAVEDVIKRNFYSTKSELVRNAVRKELERLGIKEDK